jgi:hypothetical protein
MTRQVKDGEDSAIYGGDCGLDKRLTDASLPPWTITASK